MQCTFSDKFPPKGARVVPVFQATAPPSGSSATEGLPQPRLTNIPDMSPQSHRAVEDAIARTRFRAKKGQILELSHMPRRVLLLGLGVRTKFDALAAEQVGGAVVAALQASGETEVSLLWSLLEEDTVPDGAHCALGALLRAYRFDHYRTRLSEDQKPSLRGFRVVVSSPAASRKTFDALQAIGEGVALARDLVSAPPNHLYPESFVEKVQGLGIPGLCVDVLDEQALLNQGFGALLAVGKGSEKSPRVLVLRWRESQQPPWVLIGKGVTFDSGGLSLKPAVHMEDMKYDMAGAASVVGAVVALARRKAAVHVVGICGLAENMPSRRAMKPGDIVKSLSGRTIEVLNTDAEGRLVLADLLHYAQERFKPRGMIDLATLTGAVIVALGSEQAGLFANDDGLAARLSEAGKATGEELWRFPMSAVYDKLLDSTIADVKNISAGRGAGSITAAQFLRRFVREQTPWCHLDIAGVAWRKEDSWLCPKGASGFGVRLLEKFIREEN